MGRLPLAARAATAAVRRSISAFHSGGFDSDDVTAHCAESPTISTIGSSKKTAEFSEPYMNHACDMADHIALHLLKRRLQPHHLFLQFLLGRRRHNYRIEAREQSVFRDGLKY
ncbi:hypothetical protein G5I_14416 [Acromyrmex echinatior]|uniref:Uncharacterized protein n=1 Tax=Acromyrmex echinatior TaxID=103372 RepID=F4X7N2_ACREC|nr:hypothetical protein G5I_14416 [Acromyrmex echinatior]